MGRNILAEQAEGPKSSKKEKKSKKDKKRNLAGGAEEAAAAAGTTEEVPKSSKKDKKSSKEKRKLAGEAEEAAAVAATTEEVLKSSKKKRVEDVPVERGEAENGAEKAVAVTGKGFQEAKYAPLQSFAAADLPSQVLDCCRAFARPSPIQAHAWPFLLDGRDFIGIAATGSGKTIAFGVPALMHIRKKVGEKARKRAVPRCLVLSPTRELAQQDIVIGTPGRMKDLIEMGVCCLNEVSFVVLDEADRMLDLGFEPEVRAILSQTSSVRQMVMFSATWPLAVHKLAQEFMDPNPIKVVIGSEDLAANHDVMQIVEVLEDRARDSRLLALLEKYQTSRRTLVFVLYKKEAARVEAMLQRRGLKAVSVHGDKAQHDRTKALSLFKEGKCPLMIATDVASRGLDIPDVDTVINYSYPLTTEDYVHRIGRTGRAGKKGIAHTFFTQENKGLAGELVNVLREAGQVVPVSLMKFGTHVKKKESKIYGSHFKEITADAPKSTKITFGDSDED
ncbi:hypothetical protein PR202_ga21288 [Eleusine coracana subsp. coracana]|uniref:RNA helicase n=1 Tax=Eleusine coracana subsp. coracana TaxID=191504 RepID=A0AAV5CYS4_ELECO|nr:hypothetical protein PR202_ga21288 [Eleusine coracana subsp. coracana]